MARHLIESPADDELVTTEAIRDIFFVANGSELVEVIEVDLTKAEICSMFYPTFDEADPIVRTGYLRRVTAVLSSIKKQASTQGYVFGCYADVQDDSSVIFFWRSALLTRVRCIPIIENTQRFFLSNIEGSLNAHIRQQEFPAVAAATTIFDDIITRARRALR